MPAGASSLAAHHSLFSQRGAKGALAALFLLVAALWFFSRTLLSTNFLPHWYCYAGNERVLWTHVISDFVIGSSYFAISLSLVQLVRRAGRSLPYSGVFWAFVVFIVSCGMTHYLEVVTVWRPVYWLSAIVKVITALASAGTAVVLLFASDDIVDFVRTAHEAAIRQGSNRYRALIQAAPMAVVGTDLDRRITDWNPAAEHLFGWSVDEAVGKTSLIARPDLEAERLSLREKTMSGQVTKGMETVRVNRQGDRIPVSFSVAPVYDEKGAISGTIGMFEDISERKRIQTELQEKTAVLSTVTHALNAFLETGNWKAASRRLLEFALEKTHSDSGCLGVVLEGGLLRILAQEAITNDPRTGMGAPDAGISNSETNLDSLLPIVSDLLKQVIAKREALVANSVQSAPLAGQSPASHGHISSFLGVPIFKGAEIVGLIAVANRQGGYSGQEIRYLKMMSQATGVLYDNYRQDLKRLALEEQQERLEAQVRQGQKLEVLGRLAGGVAHDFNNMLMVLGGSSELLERSLPKDSPARVHLEQIQRTTEKAAAITRQLLAFSRKQILEIRPMDLHEALTESESMIPRLLGSDVELTSHHQAARPWILCDPAQIEQIVANLAINARDAMPEGGKLAISTRNASLLPVDHDAPPSAATGDWVVLEVADSGCGMDEKTREKIFEPFFTTKPVGKGTGLGLSTVYGIIKQCHGHIRVESAPGKGSRFELYFPAVEPHSTIPQVDAVKTVREDSGEGATVLVIDDETSLRQSVVEFLRSSGFRVYEAQTADEAIEMARTYAGDIEILLTDIVMPSLRGPELARRVASLNPGIRVVFMSGYAGGLQDDELPPNAVFLQKPFRFATLLQQLKLVRRKV
jgi:PAS domain S-box-containing protein